MTRRASLLATSLLSLVVACTPTVPTAPRHDPPSAGPSTLMKGFELVSWTDASGAWTHVLVPGTNRLKRRDELLAAPARATNRAELAALLSRIAPGQTVTWQALPGDAPLGVPADLARDVQAIAQSQGIRLVGPGD